MPVQGRRGRAAAALLQIFACAEDVASQKHRNVMVDMRPHDHTQAHHLLSVGRHRVGRQHPAFLADLVRNVELIEVLQLGIEGIPLTIAP